VFAAVSAALKSMSGEVGGQEMFTAAQAALRRLQR